MKTLTNFHLIRVKHASNSNGDIWVSLYSERFKKSKRIAYNNEAGASSPSLDTAIKWLESQGFDLIGQSETTNHYYIISSTFKSI